MYVQKIQFGAPEHGWMEVTFGDRKIDASDVPCDSLQELVKAMHNFLSGSDQEVVQWSLEPDYERWIFDRTEEQAMFHIVDSDDKRWVSNTNPEALIGVIANRLNQRYEASFKECPTIHEHWSWGFPIEGLRSLQKKITDLDLP